MPRKTWEPTLAEIAASTAAIGAEWDEAEHRRRAGVARGPKPVFLPVIHLADVLPELAASWCSTSTKARLWQTSRTIG